MQFLKKHYEKIIFSLVLILLAVAAGWLSLQAKEEQQIITNAMKGILETPAVPVEPLKFDKFDAALKRMESMPSVDLAVSNHVYNPVKWIQTPPPDEKLVALRNGDEVTSQIEIRRLTPLNLVVNFEGVTGTGEQMRYVVGVLDPVARRGATTPVKFNIASASDKPNRLFTTKEIKGAGNDAELVIELKDETEPFSVTRNRPYTRVAGYLVDFAYKLDVNAPGLLSKRINDEVVFGADKYKIVAINEKEVVIEATAIQQSGKRYSIKVKAP